MYPAIYKDKDVIVKFYYNSTLRGEDSHRVFLSGVNQCSNEIENFLREKAIFE